MIRPSYDGSVSQDDPQTVQLAYYYDPCSGGGGGGTNPPTDPDPEPDEYTVSLTATPAVGGSVSGSGTYAAGSVITISATPEPGYKFTHWTRTGSATTISQRSFSHTVQSDSHFTAHFEVDIEVTLDVTGLNAQNEVTLMEDYTLNVNVVPSSTSIESVKLYYYQDSTMADYYPNLQPVFSGTSMSYTRKAIKPSYWHIRAVVETPGGAYKSPFREVLEAFPSADTILAKAVVQAEFESLWQTTKDFATAHSFTHEVQEQGAWVLLDTATGEYSVDSSKGVERHTVALVPGVTQAYVTMTMPNDITPSLSDPTVPGEYVVANFHTHYPICYALVDPPGIQHVGGPTNPKDFDAVNNTFKVPGFVYDYIGTIMKYHTDNPANNEITHGINDPAHVYKYGDHKRREIKKP